MANKNQLLEPETPISVGYFFIIMPKTKQNEICVKICEYPTNRRYQVLVKTIKSENLNCMVDSTFSEIFFSTEPGVYNAWLSKDMKTLYISDKWPLF